ncbi:tetratricopeptide repeat protein [Nannocystis pusilla]|uniref:tetratricopeptide repeat protein n=1 Tax=Nannocystis pusilla TaxID=889268 RepID=UPI003B7DC7CB
MRSALAAVRRERGELAASQALYERSIELLQRELGREHPELATTIDQLAVVFRISESTPRRCGCTSRRWRSARRCTGRSTRRWHRA